LVKRSRLNCGQFGADSTEICGFSLTKLQMPPRRRALQRHRSTASRPPRHEDSGLEALSCYLRVFSAIARVGSRPPRAGGHRELEQCQAAGRAGTTSPDQCRRAQDDRAQDRVAARRRSTRTGSSPATTPALCIAPCRSMIRPPPLLKNCAGSGGKYPNANKFFLPTSASAIITTFAPIGSSNLRVAK
jgi:hypothetical protein